MSAASPVSAHLLERLRELALVDVDVLVARLEPAAAVELLAAHVVELEDALGQARAAIRTAHAAAGAAPDPFGFLELGPERRVRGGAPAVEDARARLRERAATRRELAALEELVRGVLPRLLEADRRLVAMGGG